MPGPMVVTEQDEKVNNSEVDAIHGAKPEPEERPLTVEMKIQPGTGESEVGPTSTELVLEHAKTVSIEMTVEERAKLLGKYCGNCMHFNHARGQAKLELMSFKGDDADRAHLRSLFAELTEQTPLEELGDDIVTAEEVFAPTHAEKAMGRMGLCSAMTSAMNEDALVMPEGHCAAPEEKLIGKDLWVPKNKEVAEKVSQMRDALYGAASTVPAVTP